jgi:hypothetical protein
MINFNRNYQFNNDYEDKTIENSPNVKNYYTNNPHANTNISKVTNN